MPYMRFGGIPLAVRACLLGAVVAAATGVATADTLAPSFQVRLQIVGTCQVDSGPVVAAGARGGMGQPGVACRSGTPHSVSVGRAGAPRSGAAAGSGDTVIVTLTF